MSVAFAAAAASTAWAELTGRPPRAPLDAVRMARKKMWVTHAKAERELGYRPAPAEAALRGTPWSGSARMATAEAAQVVIAVAAEPMEFRGLLRRAARVERLDWPLRFARRAEIGGRAGS